MDIYTRKSHQSKILIVNGVARTLKCDCRDHPCWEEDKYKILETTLPFRIKQNWLCNKLRLISVPNFNFLGNKC